MAPTPSFKNETGYGAQCNRSTALVSESDAGADLLRQSLISDETMRLVNLYFMGLALGLLSLAGMCTNILNMAVFLSQGLLESSAVTFFALALSDFLGLFSLFFCSVCFGVAALLPDLRIDAFSFQLATLSWWRTMFVDISVLITVFMTTERALCVIFPFKVKTIVTKPRTVAILFSIYAFGACSYVPVYASQGLSWQWDPHLNTSRLLYWYSYERYHVEMVVNYLNSITVNTLAQCVAIVMTYILIRGLRSASDFRGNSTSASASEARGITQNRDRNVVRMVTVVSLIFIICNTPIIILVYGQVAVPDFNIGGKYESLMWIGYGATCFFAATNASVNIFIYYNLSSNFRRTLLVISVKINGTKERRT